MMGVRPRQVEYYRSQGMPRRPDGFYEVQACLEWRKDQTQRDARRRRRKAGTPAATDNGDNPLAAIERDLSTAKLEGLRLRNEQQELKNKQAAGELLPAALVDEFLAQRASWLVHDLVDNADVICARLEGLAGRAFVREFRAVMRELITEYAEGKQPPWTKDESE